MLSWLAASSSSYAPAPRPVGRRAVLQQLPLSVAALTAAAAVPRAAFADLSDLSIDVEEAPKALEGASSTAASLINASAANVQKGQEISVMGRAFLELGMLKVQEAFETEVRT